MKGQHQKKGNVCSSSRNSPARSAKVLVNGKKASSNLNNEEEHSTTTGRPPSLQKDTSQVNFRFDIRMNGFSTLLNTVNKATPKVRKLLMDECDIILECRVCRNLFRSYPNYLCHKQNFCLNQYNPATESGHAQFVQNANSLYEFQYHVDASLHEPSVLNCSPSSSNGVGESQEPHRDSRKQGARLHQILSRLSSNIENGHQTSVSTDNDNLRRNYEMSRALPSTMQNRNSKSISAGQLINLAVEPVKNRGRDGIVYHRRIIDSDPYCCDVTHNGYVDRREIAENDTAVLGPDGKIICVGTAGVVEDIVNRVVAQVEEHHGEQRRKMMELKCSICETLFETEKTLRMHIREAHAFVRKSSDNISNGVINTAKRKIPGLKHTSEKYINVSSKVDYSCASTELKLNPVISDQVSPTKRLKVMEQNISNRKITKLLFASPKLPRSTNTRTNSVLNQTVRLKNLVTGMTSTRSRGRPPKNSSSENKIMLLPVSNSLHPCNNENGNDESPSEYECSEEKEMPICLPFSCTKCSASFATKSDMSMHLARCAGVINLSFSRSPMSPEPKKISIQIRHDYDKPKSLPLLKSVAKTPGTSSSSNSPWDSANKAAASTQLTDLQKFRLLSHKHRNNGFAHFFNNNKDERKLEEVVDDEDSENEESVSTQGSASNHEDDELHVEDCPEGENVGRETDIDSSVTDSGVSTSSSSNTLKLASASKKSEISTLRQPIATLTTESHEKTVQGLFTAKKSNFRSTTSRLRSSNRIKKTTVPKLS